jgi:hypothetical protein
MEEKRYSFTKIRDKRSIVRALNTFKKQCNFIYCEKKEVDLNIEPMKLYYSDEIVKNINYDKKVDTSENDKMIDALDKNIIYNKDVESIELQNTNLICDEIDNLLSINNKKDLKEELKICVKKRDIQGINNFFKNEALSLMQIEQIVESESFAKRIFSQLKNRISFKRSGVYSTKYAKSKITKMIELEPISHADVFEIKLDYVIDKLWLYESDTQEKYKKLKKQYVEYANDENFNRDFIPSSDNTSIYHPIDESEYNDESNRSEVREANMTEAMIAHGQYGFYNQEFYDEYNEYKTIYEEYGEQIRAYIIDLLNYLERSNYEETLTRDLEAELVEIFLQDENDYAVDVLNQYNKSKQVFEKKELAIELQKLDIGQDLIQIYLYDFSLEKKIYQYKNDLNKIVNDDLNEDESDNIQNKIDEYTQIQFELMELLNCDIDTLKKHSYLSIENHIRYYDLDYDIDSIDNLDEVLEFDYRDYLYL